MGVTRAISSITAAVDEKSKPLAFIFCANWQRVQNSGRDSLFFTEITGLKVWIRRSKFVKVPDFSAKVDLGSTTSACSAAGLMKVSCTTRNSKF